MLLPPSSQHPCKHPPQRRMGLLLQGGSPPAPGRSHAEHNLAAGGKNKGCRKQLFSLEGSQETSVHTLKLGKSTMRAHSPIWEKNEPGGKDGTFSEALKHCIAWPGCGLSQTGSHGLSDPATPCPVSQQLHTSHVFRPFPLHGSCCSGKVSTKEGPERMPSLQRPGPAATLQGLAAKTLHRLLGNLPSRRVSAPNSIECS